MIAVTSGKKYIDIDGYASMIAARELYKALGEDAYAVSSAKLNQSVPPLIQDLNYKLDEVAISDDVKYVLLDISNPDFCDAPLENVIEVIDHHVGFENFWQERGVKTQIEFIGSVCTIIYERIVAAGKQTIIDENLAKLLIAGILDNTLNLRSSITTNRDKKAYEELKVAAHLSDDWSKEYFSACDEEKAKDYKTAILDDLKNENAAPSFPSIFGQMILEDPNRINYEMIADALSGYNEWVMNIISLSDGKSYFYYNCEKEVVEELFKKASQEEHLIILDDFLLRKQILKLVRENML